ncbi:DUF6093 family protein [Streptomyces filamentosus]|uniref:Uncharacterized protein n=1 Tax=Streptomyces filamentosus TaxID=67294 RepID=A0A919EPA5_STRFL|nr:DUF6093 family protein [Streptomyces filamentosus]GHG05689.1 hypothetical protein GCM10017667_40710 [Streptomyces filamentosus]
MAGLAQVRASLEALMTDTVRVRRLAGKSDPDDGAPVWATVYEGADSLLSTRGQIMVRQLLGADWLGEASAWYQLMTPLAGPVADPVDQVQVISEDEQSASAFVGRTWFVEARTQVSTVEVVRATRLDEQSGAVAVGI